MKKRMFLVHGWGGSPEGGCLPWLKEKLERQGFEVIVPQMPNTEEPEIDAWVSHLASFVGSVDENTYFVGHSIGCQAIMRYIQQQDAKIGGAWFVAGWFALHNLDEEEIEIARPWVETPIDVESVRKRSNKYVLFISDNDPFGGFKENLEGFEAIGAEINVLPGKEHIEDRELPVVLESILLTINP